MNDQKFKENQILKNMFKKKCYCLDCKKENKNKSKKIKYKKRKTFKKHHI